MASLVNLTLKRLGEGLRTRRNKIVQQRLPWRFIDLLCRLDEREDDAGLRTGDRVRLTSGDRILTVIECLEAGQVKCRDTVSDRRLIVSANDLRKIEPDDPAAQSSSR